MLTEAEDQIINGIIAKDGLSEADCLRGLSEQQRRVWVHYAVLGCSKEEILHTVFGHRKNASMSLVDYALANAQFAILVNVLRDCDPLTLQVEYRETLIELYEKVQQMKRRKGAKRLCRQG